METRLDVYKTTDLRKPSKYFYATKNASFRSQQKYYFRTHKLEYWSNHWVTKPH